MRNYSSPRTAIYSYAARMHYEHRGTDSESVRAAFSFVIFL